MAEAQERARSFGAVAAEYDRLRPQAPDEAVDWLVPDGCRTAVDLGAGTGLLTRKLAGRAGEVIAVEPDPRMRAVLAERSPGVRVVEGTGEAIPLPDASADGVFVSSAWHWMDPELAVPEIARVLRAGGRFAVIWTSRDREVGWLRDLTEQGTPGLAKADVPQAEMRPDVRWPQPGSGWRHHEVSLPGGAPFRTIETRTFRFTRTMSMDDAVDLMATYSRMIIASEQDRSAQLARIRTALLDRFPGADRVELPMRSHCWRAERDDRTAGPSAP
jgi:SAM-dependent methyltransferase